MIATLTHPQENHSAAGLGVIEPLPLTGDPPLALVGGIASTAVYTVHKDIPCHNAPWTGGRTNRFDPRGSRVPARRRSCCPLRLLSFFLLPPGHCQLPPRPPRPPHHHPTCHRRRIAAGDPHQPVFAATPPPPCHNLLRLLLLLLLLLLHQHHHQHQHQHRRHYYFGRCIAPAVAGTGPAADNPLLLHLGPFPPHHSPGRGR